MCVGGWDCRCGESLVGVGVKGVFGFTHREPHTEACEDAVAIARAQHRAGGGKAMPPVPLVISAVRVTPQGDVDKCVWTPRRVVVCGAGTLWEVRGGSVR